MLQILAHPLVYDAIADKAKDGMDQYDDGQEHGEQLGILGCGQNGKDPHDTHDRQRYDR